LYIFSNPLFDNRAYCTILWTNKSDVICFISYQWRILNLSIDKPSIYLLNW